MEALAKDPTFPQKKNSGKVSSCLATGFVVALFTRRLITPMVRLTVGYIELSYPKEEEIVAYRVYKKKK